MERPAKTLESAAAAPGTSPVPAAIVGLGVGLLICLLNVLVLFRTGTGFGGSTLVVLLAAAALRWWGKLDRDQLFVAFSTASSGYFATAALDSGIVATQLRTGSLPPWLPLLLAAVAANLVGVGIGAWVARGYVDGERLPYPTLRPAIALIDAATGRDSRRTSTLVRAALVAAAIAGVAVATGAADGHPLPGLPPYLTVAVSPLLVGAGMLIGARACAWVAIGAACTGAVWLLRDHADGRIHSYDAHLAFPWVLAVGVGIVVGHALVGLVRTRGALRRTLIGADDGRRPRRPVGAAVALAALVLAAVIVPGVGRWLAVTAAGLLLLVLWVHFLNRAGGEVGIAPLSPVLYLSVIALAALGLRSGAGLIVGAALCCAALASVYCTYAVKVARSGPAGADAPLRPVWWTQALGGGVGAAAGIGMVWLIAAGGVGDAEFPVPIAQALALVQSTAEGSASYGGAVAAALTAGGALGAALGLTTALPTMLGLGILLPPAAGLALALGGALRWLLLRRSTTTGATVDQIASGLIVGEGLLMVVVLGIRAAAVG